MNSKIYRKLSEVMVTRASNKIDLNLSPHKRETDALFFWIMCQFEDSISRALIKKTLYGVKILEKYSKDSDRVVLQNAHNLQEFRSQFVDRNEFYEIVEEVTTFLRAEKNYTANCSTPISEEKSSSSIQMNLALIVPKKENAK